MYIIVHGILRVYYCAWYLACILLRMVSSCVFIIAHGIFLLVSYCACYLACLLLCMYIIVHGILHVFFAEEGTQEVRRTQEENNLPQVKVIFSRCDIVWYKHM